MEYPKLAFNGNEYPLCFEVGSIRILEEEFKLDIFEMFQNFKGIGKITTYLPKIVYAAMCNYCSKENVKKEFTYEEVLRWFDGQKLKDLTMLTNLVTDKYLDPMMETLPSGEVKDKAEPFHLEGHRENMPGADADAPVGAGPVHVTRPFVQAAGVR